MTSSVTSAYASLSYLVSGIADPVEAKSVSGANTALSFLINTPDYVDSLVAHSSVYLPPTSVQVMSTLWGLLNAVDGTTELTRTILERAVVTQGGSYSSATHLWEQLELETQSSLSPKDFIQNSYLMEAMPLVFDSIQESVEDTRIQNAILSGGTTTGTLFDFYTGSSGSGSLLDFVT